MLHRWLRKPEVLISSLLMLALVLVVACGSSATATPRPAATAAPAAAATATPAPAAPAATATPVPGAPAATATPVPVAQPKATTAPPPVAAGHTPTGELTVAMATFGNERWLPGATAGAEATAFHPIFENLLTRDTETGDNVGELAESWEVREGGKVWEFRMRKGVQFHDGWGEVTADDVQFSFERFGAEGASNARRAIFQKIEEYGIPDSHTIILNFSTPEILLGGDVNSGIPGTQYIYPKKYVIDVGDEKADLDPIATGPYKLANHVRGDRMEFEAVEDHWKLTPAFANMTFLKVVEDSTRLAMVRAGSVDIIGIGVDFAGELKAADVRTVTVPRFASVGITLGGLWPTKETYDPTVPWALPDEERAKKVRVAFNMAVDKQAVVDAALGGLATANVAVGQFYSGEPWTLEEFEPIGYDPDRARALMEEAGFPNCFEFTMNLIAWPGRAFLPLVGEAVATQLEAELGCEITRRPLDRAVFATDFRERTYPGVALAYAMPFVGREPWQLWRLLGRTNSAAMLSFEDPKADAFMDQLESTADFDKRVEIMQEWGRFINDKVPRIEIAEVLGIFGVGDRVKTWPLAPGNGFIHNTTYVNLVWAPPGQPVVLAK